MPPGTRYAKSGDVNIAYQVVGDGAFAFAGRGEREIKGVGSWRLHSVRDA
jgi:hypothetical protein